MAPNLADEWNRTSNSDKEALKAFFGEMELKEDMAVLICKAHVSTKDAAPLDIAMIVTVLRDLLGPFWFEEGELVKEDAEKFFCICESVDAAARMALNAIKKIEALRKDSPLTKILMGLSCGIAAGAILTRPGPGGDLYGHPVNIASKLGEDTAQPGELLIACSCLPPSVPSQNWPLEGATLVKTGTCVVSKVDLEYKVISPPQPDPDEHEQLMQNLLEEETEDPLVQRFLNMSDNEISPEEDKALFDQYHAITTLVNTDLSGFTRVVEKRGLVQFLLLIAKEREVMKESMSKHGGELVKFEGDNVIARFDDPLQAMDCIVQAHNRMHEYNESQDESTKQVMMCMGVEQGEILVMGEDLFGWAWDVSYYLGEEFADGSKHEMLLGPNIREITSGKWNPPEAVRFEPTEVDINGTKIKASRMYTSLDAQKQAKEAAAAKMAEEDAVKKAAEERRKEEEAEQAAAARKADEEKAAARKAEQERVAASIKAEEEKAAAAAAKAQDQSDGDMAAGSQVFAKKPSNMDDDPFLAINSDALKKAQEKRRTSTAQGGGLLCCCSGR